MSRRKHLFAIMHHVLLAQWERTVESPAYRRVSLWNTVIHLLCCHLPKSSWCRGHLRKLEEGSRMDQNSTLMTFPARAVVKGKEHRLWIQENAIQIPAPLRPVRKLWALFFTFSELNFLVWTPAVVIPNKIVLTIKVNVLCKFLVHPGFLINICWIQIAE